MAQEEIQKPAASTPAPLPTPSPTPVPPKEETPAPVNPVTDKDVPVAASASETTEEKVTPVPEPEVEVTATKEGETPAGKVMLQTESFKEESYVATELPEAQKKALDEFKEMVREALNKREFTAPPPPPVKEEETPAVIETKTEEKPADPVTTETKTEEKATASEPVEAAPAAPVTTQTKKEETATVPAPAAPVTTEAKKEEKTATTTPAAPVVTETKKEEKATTPAPAAPVSTETKTEEKSTTPAPAAPVVTETKKEEKATVSAPVVTETKKEEEKSIASAPETVVTIEKAFAAEEGTKTVEAIEESIVSVTVPEPAAPEPVEPEEISIWGIPLLEDERSDVVLLKFLRARDFKVKEAFTMLKNTVQWRKENNIDDLVGEDLDGSEFEKMVFTHGVDKQGHVVIYSSYGEFQNKEIFSDKQKLNKFLKWRIQFQEKCVRALDFSPDAKSSFVFVSDFRNAPGLGKRALWQFIRRAVKQFEDNYPEFVAKELFINVPWWYIPYYKTFGSIITSPRTRSKMVLAGPSKSADTIFKYVAPEVVPVKYGGLSKESPFTAEDGVTEAIVKSAAKYTIDLPASEGSTISWELRVGTDVTYGAQFEPSNESSYTVIVSKDRKIGLTDEPVITGSFKANEPGKIVITIDNQTYKKKKVLYRFKTLPSN